MYSELNALDKATLRFWRASNVLGWGGLAAFLAFYIHWTLLSLGNFTSVAGFHRGGPFTPELGPGDTIGTLAKRLVIVLIAGHIIGRMVARRIYVAPIALSALVALAYLFTSALMLEHTFSGAGRALGLYEAEIQPNSLARALLHDLTMALAIPYAMLVARDTVRAGRSAASLRG